MQPISDSEWRSILTKELPSLRKRIFVRCFTECTDVGLIAPSGFPAPSRRIRHPWMGTAMRDDRGTLNKWAMKIRDEAVAYLREQLLLEAMREVGA